MHLSPITSVFHPTDLTQGDQGAFAHALRIALAARCDLSLLHVERHADEADWDDFPSVRDMLARWGVIPPDADRHAVAQAGLRVSKAQKVNRDPSEAIGRHVSEHLPDLVVLSTHQRQGLARLVKPALAEAIARTARVRTLFVPRRVPGFVAAETGAVKLRRVLVPVDQHPRPRTALAAAAGLVKALGAGPVHFTLLHVGPDESLPAMEPPVEPGWTFESTVADGDVVDTILEVSDDRDVDLIVMATRGHHGFLDALRGSTTERVLRGAKCPLLAVPAV